MWIAENFNDYSVIDCGDGEKLERWGDYILIRPDPQVIWNTPKESEWKKANARYIRSNKGGGYCGQDGKGGNIRPARFPRYRRQGYSNADG